MKVRPGFVSNSSSASFVVAFESTHPKEEIQQHLDLLCYRKDSSYSGLISHEDGRYSFLASTSMFNDWYDVMEWKFIRMLCEVDPSISGYTLVSLKQTEDGNMQTNNEVRFDYRPWDYRHVEDTKEEKELEEKLREVNGAYIKYLHKLNLPTDKLLLLDAMFYDYPER